MIIIRPEFRINIYCSFNGSVFNWISLISEIKIVNIEKILQEFADNKKELETTYKRWEQLEETRVK